jgi:hypothetical protein
LEVVEGDKIAAQSIGEIEVEIAHYTQLGDQAHVPGGLHPLDLYYAEQDAKQTRYIALVRVKGYKAILERIKSRIHDFLSQTEKQLLYGQIHADIFEQNRQYVDLKLGELCPDALAKFISAYQRMKEDEPESWAQALTSCRRLLKSLTDVLYPAQDKPVIGHDGKERTLTDELYISRLWQYIFEQTSHSASGELLLVEVKDLGDRLDRIYDLACKGVHDEISKVEVNQCVIQTYILIGDLLRISEKVTAVGMEIH